MAIQQTYSMLFPSSQLIVVVSFIFDALQFLHLQAPLVADVCLKVLIHHFAPLVALCFGQEPEMKGLGLGIHDF